MTRDAVLIDTNAGLAEALAALKGEAVVALDTEFMREKTYYAKLCLLQIASSHRILLIDMLAIRELRPLAELLSDPQVTKVFHAAAQDLEVLYQACGVIPAPIFDTQDGAELAGYPLQVGYGALVAGELGVKLDKADSFTDWSRRPLTGEQLKYAADDVSYLLELYPRLSQKLAEMGRLNWIEEALQAKTDPALLDPDPRQFYRRVKHISRLKGVHLAVAREVAAWREEQARRLNKPRRWILGDESLIEIAQRIPENEAELLDIRGVNMKNNTLRRTLMEAVGVGSGLDKESWPELPGKRRMTRDLGPIVDAMSALLRLRAGEHHIAAALLATRAQLETLAAAPEEPCALLTGWRRELVGAELLELLRGELVLSVADDRLSVERKPQT